MRTFIGVYDVFSSMIVSKQHPDLFLSGLCYTASHYGLPDIGFLTWEDILSQSQQIVSRCPGTNLLVDIDDGFGGAEIAGHVTRELEKSGAFGVVLEDQKRPKKCGHLPGKHVLPLDEYLVVLDSVLSARKRLFVVARTDCGEEAEAIKRIKAFSQLPVDAILVDGIGLEAYRNYQKYTAKPLVYNYIAGGKTRVAAGDIEIMLMSTPCLAAAGRAIKETVEAIESNQFDQLRGYSLKEIRVLSEQGFSSDDE